MNIDQYLKRINFLTSPKVDLKTLIELQHFHLKTVPFENLDIHFNNPIVLNIEHIYDKVINKNRGGFCYELNGLFYYLLHQIGFKVKMISAQVHIKDGVYSDEFDHMGIIVDIEGVSYLVDVGFGKFSLSPLKIEIDTEINDELGVFMFKKEEDYFTICEVENGKVIPQYRFKEQERALLDFENMCNFHKLV
ncbi:arylamine N-acetyltransferase family protein [Empedobacter brevis]|uniref:arylamine N-acetyltransferase family protein n=1 Tax=Empedobacter brevis TaxID=247 RepID=UPI00289D45E1|nr:arylamine N-acetyltransferase [Empedobacter brevis]